VSIAVRKHPIPSRTRKLSSPAANVVPGGLGVRIARCIHFFKSLSDERLFLFPKTSCSFLLTTLVKLLGMISKILKFQLFSLFFITLTAFIAHYCQDYLSDSFYSISGASQDISFLGYYLSTLILGVGYYTGPWLLVPFFIFSLFYSFLYSKREFALDMTNAVSLVGGALLLTYFFYPEFLGRGLFYSLHDHMSELSLGVLLLGFGFAFLAGTFRDSFKESVINCFKSLAELPQMISKRMSGVKVANPVQGLQKNREGLKNFLLVKIPNILKNKKKESALILEKVQPKIAPIKTKKAEVVEEKVIATPVPKMDVAEASEAKSSVEKPKVIIPVQVDGKDDSYHTLAALELQKRTSISDKNPDNAYFEDIIHKFEEKFSEFGVDGRIVNILKGPVVDTFEVGLGLGVLVSKVTKIENELSIALSGTPLRIVYPLPGKTTIGIEVPRSPRQFIYLDEVIDHETFQSAGHRLPIAMGKDTFGEPVCVDLAKMPHMLIAGSTGAGKSVFINTLLVSLLVKRSPKEMKLILIDPKQLELALYSRLPHLIMPVVTEPKLTNVALLWAIQEMEKRYKLIGDLNVRNIDSFNEKVKVADPETLARIHHFYDDDAENGYTLPYIVIIVDEYADLILAKEGKEIERAIAKLAAKARASGIHLVVATQRPSVDVITGVIKSNFPTRVSFRVTSNADSRTILDTVGAEKLLGNGDMLYKYATSTTRLHSSFISDEEIEIFTEQISGLPQRFNEKAVNFLESEGASDDEAQPDMSRRAAAQKLSEKDEKIFWEAVDLCIEYRQVSTSFLQRHLALGFPKAAKITDELERRGVIGPRQGASMRKVIITSANDVGAP
jgi:S-DNA-T family DNA segregation ATPase FtsK/SpoIIIE